MQKLLTSSSQFDFSQSIINTNQHLWIEQNNFEEKEILFEKLFFIKTDFSLKAKLLKFTKSHIIYSESKTIHYQDAQISFIYGNKNHQIGIKFTKGDNSIDIIGDFGLILSHIKQNTIQIDFHEKFRLQTLIGRGNRSEVYRAIQKNEGNEVSVKIFDKSKFKKEKEIKALMNEIKYLRILKHEKILSLIELFEDKKYVYIITPLLKGGDLSQLVQQNGLTEEKCQIILEQVFEGINYLHQQKLFHRDLKPQNLMLQKLNDINTIIIIDLGLVEQYEEDAILNCNRCGTQGFIAPEVLKGLRYNTKVDVFCLGLILFYLLTAKKPFSGISSQEIYQNNLIGVVNLNNLHCSQVCLDFLRKCLNIDPNLRLTSYQALQHQFLKKQTSKTIQNLSLYQNQSNQSNSSNCPQIKQSRISCSKLRRIKTLDIQEPQEEDQMQVALKTTCRQFVIRKSKFF